VYIFSIRRKAHSQKRRMLASEPMLIKSIYASKPILRNNVKKQVKRTYIRMDLAKNSSQYSSSLHSYIRKAQRIHFTSTENCRTIASSNRSRYRLLRSSYKVTAEKNVHTYLDEGLGSVVLLCATAVAIFLANSTTMSPIYRSFLSSYFGPVTLNLSMSLHHWVNEGLMALFFFAVGLEIKREFIHGSLSSLKKAILPCIGAFGGMIAPMLVYLVCNLNSPSGILSGWAIPMATDIAFAMGVYGFFKHKMPNGVAAFLLTLATVDDLGAIVVIAICFAKELSLGYIFAAVLSVIALITACKNKLTNISFYMLLFAILWYSLYQGGINADIAGVVTALSIPGTALAPTVSMAPPEHEGAEVTLLDHLIHAWSPWTTLIIMPLFALANTGVLIDQRLLSSVAISPVGQGIFFGLILGKPLGIAGLSWLSVKFGVASFPKGMTMRHLGIVGILGGIGFTMSLFLIEVSLATFPEVVTTAKMAILSSSLLSALLAAFLMARLPKYSYTKND
jgi:Na+:H+ antiporter, NhaA family